MPSGYFIEHDPICPSASRTMTLGRPRRLLGSDDTPAPFPSGLQLPCYGTGVVRFVRPSLPLGL